MFGMYEFENSSFCFLLFCLVLCGMQLVFFTGCVISCFTCFVWTRGLWVSLLAACSCPVLHMVSDFVLLAMCLYFCFVWACGFCHSFCVPCVPTHLVSWLLVNFPHLCQLITLLICSLYNILVFAVLCEFVFVCSPVVCWSCLAKPASSPFFPPTG